MNQPARTLFHGHKTIQRQEEINENLSDTCGNNSEASFLLFGDSLSSIISTESLNKTQSNFEDSFMATLSLNNRSADSEISLSIVDEVKKLMVSKPDLLSPNKTNLEVPETKVKELTTSYIPNYVESKRPCALYQSVESPIKKCEEKITVAEIKKLFKQELDSERTDIKYEMRKIGSDLRNHIFGFQWFVIKEFMKIENTLNKFKHELATDEGFVEETLLQENQRLREENEYLKKSLRGCNKL